VIIYAVNDGAVMGAWAKDQGAEGSMVKFLGDPTSEMTQALGMVLDDAGVMGVLGNPRCKRFALFVDDGIIKVCNVSEGPGDPAGDGDPSASMVDAMLASI